MGGVQGAAGWLAIHQAHAPVCAAKPAKALSQKEAWRDL
jgi:hypothetical protein